MKPFTAIILAAAAGLVLYRLNPPPRDPGTPPDESTDQEAGILETAKVAAMDLIAPSDNVDPAIAAANRRAFLDMLAYSEGTATPEGYRTLFGGGLFPDFADHPRIYQSFTNKRGEVLKTSAAGRYQFLARTWDSLKAKLNLPDFGPDSQDAAALELVRQRGALGDVDRGDLQTAIDKVAPIWASLPGAGYAQPERKFAELQNAYRMAGGEVAAA